MLKIEFLKKSPGKQNFSGVRKSRTLTNSDFRVCESLELSPICTKKIHTACVLGHQRAYRLSSGTPDAPFEHYLQQIGEKGASSAHSPRKKLSIWSSSAASAASPARSHGPQDKPRQPRTLSG